MKGLLAKISIKFAFI